MNMVISKTLSICDADITFVKFDLSKHGLTTQLAEALAECERIVGLDTVARQTFFLSEDVDPAELAPILDSAYGVPTPVTSYVNQSPADGYAVTCEFWCFSSQVRLQRAPHLTWVSTSSATLGFVGGRTAILGDNGGHGVQRMLGEVAHDLRCADLDFEQMARTWYYIGEILGQAGSGCRYDQFNAARNEVYRDQWPDLCLTPASTGIGMTTGEVVFEGLFIRPKSDAVQVSWLDNPLQTPPHLYDIPMAQSRKPSFSRAAAVRLADTMLTFISGTASIRSSEVIHPEDAAAQTETTIENMAALVGGAGLDDLQQLRVYIKRREDVAAVRDRCRALLPDAPCAYLIADVCKPDCLVEIEGIHCTSSLVGADVAAYESTAYTNGFDC